jgi:hypothetical protein
VAGTEGVTWHERNKGGWSTLLPHYIEATGGDTGDVRVEA